MRTLAAILFLLLPVVATAQSSTATERAIRVGGTGKASANPDMLHMYVAVVTIDSSAQTAATANSATVTSVLSALRSGLGAGSMVTTVSYTLEPRIIYPRDGGEPTNAGYIVRNTLKVQTTELGKVGALIDAAIAAGANNVNGITYVVRDDAKLRNTALAAAVADARAKAETIAQAGGLRLGPIRLIEESVAMQPMYRGGRTTMADAASATPIQDGPVEAHANVIITFDIAQ